MEQTSDRLIWRMDVLKTFLESCIEEVSLNGRCGSSLKAESWDGITDVLATTHNFVATKKKMKNQYDYIKEKYQAWLPLTKKTGNIYDPTTNTIQMSNSEWEEYIKVHPKAKVLKRSPLAFPELCTTLFESSTTTDIHGWSSSCTAPRPGASSASPNIDLDDLQDLVDEQNEEAFKDFPSQSSISIEKRNMGKKRKKPSSRLEIDEKISIALELLINKNNAPKVEECMEKLDGLGWGDPLYSAAVSILCEGDSYRKAWMKLTETDKLENRVKVMGKKWVFFNFVNY
ncbi:hypothetical protein P3L10_015898 [Capsicum annuum]|uniref:uncharacterized protein LOC107870959 n=1 Tax=Capsicum annuum TaxID=4072 RepID=UPI0007BF7EE9|nr:uncharacterized protein LOC107870959 [Capsicum annuum]